MSRRRHVVMMLLPLLAMPVPLSADAQTAMPASASTLDPAARREIVEAFAREMRERYVFPKQGERVAEQVTTALAAGKYDDSRTTTELAHRLSADASAITHDAHLEILGPRGAPRPPAPQAKGPPTAMEAVEAGITRADKLAGGVGYIEVRSFPSLSSFKRVINAAMSGLSGSRALIIDVRRNGGGDPESVTYLVSFLVPPDRPISAFVMRTAKTNDTTRRTFRSVHTPATFVNVPVYVLTSKDTFSGGEEFAYDIQALKRGTLIGETTGGGANPAGSSDLGHGVTALIPFGRPENPITKTNWDGVGVRPDIAVSTSLALTAALTKSGSKPAVDVANASIQRVFTPRTTPLPGTGVAVRKLLSSITSGAPLKAILAPELNSYFEQTLPKRRAELTDLGELRSVNFYRVARFQGGDVYKLTFAKGQRNIQIAIGDNGIIEEASAFLPLEPGQ